MPPSPAANNSAISDAALKFNIRDPIFPDQWHLINDAIPSQMINVTPVWEAGITGKGVVAAMVDDGLDFTSDDLADNFVSGEQSNLVSPHQFVPGSKWLV
jgi:kexin